MGTDLGGKVVVITGASGDIGSVIVRRLLADGALVVNGSRRAPDPGLGVDHVETDLGDPVACVRLIDAAVERHGRIDVLINNAAYVPGGTVEKTDPAELALALTTNFVAPFLLAQAAIPGLRRAGGGTIVNIATVDAFSPPAGLAAYAASKAALLSLTRSVALENGGDGIRSVSVCPSYVATQGLEDYFDAADDPAAARQAAVDLHPIGRISEPSEIAALVAWLVSDEAGFATGQSFVLDGGLTSGHFVGGS